MRLIARGYAALIVLVFACAWIAEIHLQRSPQEHLLLDMLVAIAAMPSTFGVVYFGDAWRLTELAQLSLLSLAAAAQALALLALARFTGKRVHTNEE
jgi:hypothetical protein